MKILYHLSMDDRVKLMFTQSDCVKLVSIIFTFETKVIKILYSFQKIRKLYSNAVTFYVRLNYYIIHKYTITYNDRHDKKCNK